MKITDVRLLHVDAGWRPWSFVKIITNDGITGWSECTESNGSPRGIEGVVIDLAPHLIGKDPLEVRMRMDELSARTRQSPGSVVQKALGGIENALLDVIGKSEGVPVYTLFGKRRHDALPLYWSHCGTSRVRAWNMILKPQIKTSDDLMHFGKEVQASGFHTVKTNIGILDAEPYVYMPGFGRSTGSLQGEVSAELLDKIELWVSTMREALGPDINVALDLNFNFNTDACIRIAQKLERYSLSWLEIDMYDPNELKKVSTKIATPIVSCENILGLQNYRPFFTLKAMNDVSVDVIWNGFQESVNIATAARDAEMQVSPHNYNGHLSTFISAQWALISDNLKLMEYDVDDVPWRDALFTSKPNVQDGSLKIADAPGWGCDVREEVIAAHPWPKNL